VLGPARVFAYDEESQPPLEIRFLGLPQPDRVPIPWRGLC
jgi:hypothetical protein